MTPEDLAYDNIRKNLEMLDLWKHIDYVHTTTHDRIFFRAFATMHVALQWLVSTDRMQRGHVSGGPHDLALVLFASAGPLEDRTSYRETKRPSLQVVVGEGRDDYLYGDADIDLASPSMDVVGFFTHLAEILTPGPTNHIQLARRVNKEYARWQRAYKEAHRILERKT